MSRLEYVERYVTDPPLFRERENVCAYERTHTHTQHYTNYNYEPTFICSYLYNKYETWFVYAYIKCEHLYDDAFLIKFYPCNKCEPYSGLYVPTPEMFKIKVKLVMKEL